jgi:hypothetical protein
MRVELHVVVPPHQRKCHPCAGKNLPGPARYRTARGRGRVKTPALSAAGAVEGSQGRARSARPLDQERLIGFAHRRCAEIHRAPSGRASFCGI